MKFHLSSAGALFYITEPSLFCRGMERINFWGARKYHHHYFYLPGNENEKKILMDWISSSMEFFSIKKIGEMATGSVQTSRQPAHTTLQFQCYIFFVLSQSRLLQVKWKNNEYEILFVFFPSRMFQVENIIRSDKNCTRFPTVLSEMSGIF